MCPEHGNVKKLKLLCNHILHLKAPRTALSEIKLSIVSKIEMGPEITEITYHGPRNASLGRGKLSRIFYRRITFNSCINA